MKQRLITALSGNLKENKSVPFWSWNNALNEDELVKQINDMHSVGIGGFIMHARLGLSDEYLGEKWFSCIAACLKRARELDMEAWIYDENGWPSGFAGGKLLQNADYLARFLQLEKGNFEGSAFAVFVSDEKLGFCRVTAPKTGYAGEYYNIYLRGSPSNTDILNPNVVSEFISATHEKYYERFKDSFGRELCGFFTDEPQYYRGATPYTPYAEQFFKKDGEDIKDGLIWLFVHDERGYAFRTKYYGALSELYAQNYYKKLYDWCENHNCKLTGHSIEENSLYGQMWGCAAVTPSYEFEHIPAIDCLLRYDTPLLSSKQVGSAASQLGKKLVLTESFACSGHDVTPEELKNIAEIQYFNGVNKTCQHLYPYSLAGQGKTDHPPVFSPQSNWFEGFKQFNDYFTRLGYIVSNTQEVCDVAVLSPMRDIWLDYVRAEDYQSVKQTETDFNALLSDLRRFGVTYQIIDESILARHGKAEGNKLRVGNMLYNKIIVPKMRTISAQTAKILKQYGGKLCVLGDIGFIGGVRAQVGLKSNLTLAEIKNSAAVKFFTDSDNCFITARSGELGDFIFVKNSSLTEPATLKFERVAENYSALNLQNLTFGDITNDITLQRCGSLVLVKNSTAAVYNKTRSVQNVTADFCVSGVSDNFLVCDYASFSYNGVDYSPTMPVPELFERLLRADYVGKLFIKHEFNVSQKVSAKLVMEKLNLTSAQINGADVAFLKSAFDINFVEADVTPYIKAGKNVFVYGLQYYQHEGVHYALFSPEVTESLRNCLYYDTHIENVYLKGDFVVNNDNSLAPGRGLPALSSQNYKNGYPFFKGSLFLNGVYNYVDGGERILCLSGRFVTAIISCNGKKTVMALGTQINITSLLSEGKNQIQIELRSSLRNLFGPHHYVVEEPLGVAPYMFNMRGDWGQGVAKNYVPQYNCVPFGVDEIRIISEY